MAKSGYERARFFKQTYEKDNVSVIIRDGTMSVAPSNRNGISVIEDFNSVALVAHVVSVEQKDYASLTEEEWVNAGYKSGAEEGLELAEAVDIALDSPVCVITIIPTSLEVKRKRNAYGQRRRSFRR